MNLYSYGTGNRLEARNTYFYSPFFGRDLFACWKLQRDGAFLKAGNSSSCPSEEKPSGQLMARLVSGLSRGIAGSAEWLLIDKLLQRFEVTKRLHGEYNSNWRPVDPADYHDMENYLRFAELMDLAYQSSDKLQYLNAFLKSLDTLTALVDRLDAQQLNRLKQLTGSERDYVENLALKVGVTLTEPLK